MNRVLGYCAVCQQLVRIIPGAYKGSGRQQHWWILDHDVDGTPCPGAGRKL